MTINSSDIRTCIILQIKTHCWHLAAQMQCDTTVIYLSCCQKSPNKRVKTEGTKTELKATELSPLLSHCVSTSIWFFYLYWLNKYIIVQILDIFTYLNIVFQKDISCFPGIRIIMFFPLIQWLNDDSCSKPIVNGLPKLSMVVWFQVQP